MTDEQKPVKEEQQAQKQFAIQKLYIKDSSFESPSSPNSFRFQKWEPKIDLNITNNSRALENNTYETVLQITITANQDDSVAFLVEVQQAGLFAITGFDDGELQYLLGSQCMNILLPYAREVVSDLTVRGGFPPLVISPVNFDALYQQHLEQQAKKGEGDSTH